MQVIYTEDKTIYKASQAELRAMKKTRALIKWMASTEPASDNGDESPLKDAVKNLDAAIEMVGGAS